MLYVPSLRRWLALLVPLAFGLALLADAPKKPSKVALLVGVNTYSKRGLADKPLAFAERDVTELSKVLTKAGFSVRLLTGKDKAAVNKLGEDRS
jgi:Caspase domain